MKRPTLHYVALSALFVCAVTYQVPVAEYRFPRWFHRTNAVEGPFYPDVGPEGVSVHFLSGEAREAGLKDGDRLVAVNGRPLTGTAVYGEALARARPGEVMALVSRMDSITTLPAEFITATEIVSL
jgi:hypothetical protein